MFETTIQVKPPDQWRPGMTWDGLEKKSKVIANAGHGRHHLDAHPDPDRNADDGVPIEPRLRVYGRSLHDIAGAGEQVEQH